MFTTSYICLKPSNYLSHVNRGTTSMCSRTITSFNSLTLLSFSCFYNTLIWIPISMCYIIILFCIRLLALYRQCLINCFCSNYFYSLSESAASLSPCDCSRFTSLRSTCGFGGIFLEFSLSTSNVTFIL